MNIKALIVGYVLTMIFIIALVVTGIVISIEYVHTVGLKNITSSLWNGENTK